MAERRLPPGPRSRLLQAYAYMRSSYGYFTATARRYGDPFTMKTLDDTVIVTGDPEGVRQIFSADPETFGPFERQAVEPINGASSIMVLTGERQKRERSLLARPLSGASMPPFGPLIQQAALRRAAAWRPGEPFRMLEFSEGLTLEVLVRTLLGAREEDEVRALERAATALTAALAPPSLPRRLAGLGGRRRVERAFRRLEELDRAVYRQIHRRREEGGEGPAVLPQLCRARYEDGAAPEDETLRDQMVTLLLAGQKTTGTATAWAFHHLHRHPEVRRRLLEELAPLGPEPDPDAVVRLPYLEAVCYESLRLNPTVSDVPRTLLRPFTLLGYELPPGLAVCACITLVHLREDLYPDGRRFRPERFVGRRYSQFEFLPFGGGLRRCPGAYLALSVMKITLATLLARYRLRLTDPRPARLARRGTIMCPRGGVEMTAEERR